MPASHFILSKLQLTESNDGHLFLFFFLLKTHSKIYVS